MEERVAALGDPLPDEERQSLEHLKDAVCNRDVVDWLNEWSNLVDEFEALYDLGVDDYTNDVCTRQIIDRLVKHLPDDAVPEFRQRLAQLDDRFIAATVEVNEELLAHDTVPNDRLVNFYWFRIPRRVGEEFEIDLARQGIHRK